MSADVSLMGSDREPERRPVLRKARHGRGGRVGGPLAESVLLALAAGSEMMSKLLRECCVNVALDFALIAGVE